jgi:hypothetical protein
MRRIEIANDVIVLLLDIGTWEHRTLPRRWQYRVLTSGQRVDNDEWLQGSAPRVLI